MTGVRESLAEDELTVIGRLRAASNATLLCETAGGLRCVYKPVAGERPLWDFPDGTLARRELAFAALDEALGTGAVPPTAWRADGPYGAGMCQLWIEEDPETGAIVDIVPSGACPPGWLVSFRGEDEAGNGVDLVHRDLPGLAAIAVLDAVANNADRKAGHLLVDRDGRIRAIDHGVAFHEEPKLRTVLWGWAGEAVPDQLADVSARLGSMRGSLPPAVTGWLDDAECQALDARIASLVDRGRMPVPSTAWPAIPWPVY